jgi:DNA-binding XRE family transcriptional regulator
MKKRLTPGERLRAWRKSCGRTIAQCAECIGVTDDCWVKWERSVSRPRWLACGAVIDLTGIDLCERAQ